LSRSRTSTSSASTRDERQQVERLAAFNEDRDHEAVSARLEELR
jgi:hypothetical protein